jgi:hypothetical protein
MMRKDDLAILMFREEVRRTRIQDGYEMFSKIEELMESHGCKRMKL